MEYRISPFHLVHVLKGVWRSSPGRSLKRDGRRWDGFGPSYFASSFASYFASYFVSYFVSYLASPPTSPPISPHNSSPASPPTSPPASHPTSPPTPSSYFVSYVASDFVLLLYLPRTFLRILLYTLRRNVTLHRRGYKYYDIIQYNVYLYVQHPTEGRAPRCELWEGTTSRRRSGGDLHVGGAIWNRFMLHT